jgi:hypothetical protein
MRDYFLSTQPGFQKSRTLGLYVAILCHILLLLTVYWFVGGGLISRTPGRIDLFELLAVTFIPAAVLYGMLELRLLTRPSLQESKLLNGLSRVGYHWLYAMVIGAAYLRMGSHDPQSWWPPLLSPVSFFQLYFQLIRELIG